MESSNSIQIFVRSFYSDNRSLSITVSPNQTLKELKLSLRVSPGTLDCSYFSYNGKPLPDFYRISEAAIRPFSTLILRLRALGGGGDGGATGAESRDCYLNMYAVKKPDKVDPNETRLSKWTTCGLSGEPLNPPCVVDFLGNVFNKEKIVEALLGKKLPKELGHIKGLKDTIRIELDEIPGVELDETSFGTRFQCPISGLEFNGKYKFFALRKCGHVLSVKATKEVKMTSCLVCHSEFEEDDKIVINGDAEEVEILRKKMEEEKAKLLKEKKEKKSKNGEMGGNGVEISGKKRAEGNGKIAALEDGKSGLNSASKRLKVSDKVPANATKAVYASIFTSSKKKDFKETYSCRSLPLGRN